MTEGGWTGVLNFFAPTATTASVTIAADAAKANVRQEATVKSISAKDWGRDETVRVYFAIFNDDGTNTADIKSAGLSAESIDIVLKRYAADKKEREKPTPNAEAATLEKAIAAIQLNVANAETDVGNIGADLKAAIAAGNTMLVENLRVNLRVAVGELKSKKANLKTEKSALEKLRKA